MNSLNLEGDRNSQSKIQNGISFMRNKFIRFKNCLWYSFPIRAIAVGAASLSATEPLSAIALQIQISFYLPSL
jgi:hypothetical protein